MPKDRSIDHKLIAEVQKHAAQAVHHLADVMSIYLGAIHAYRGSGKQMWLDEFDRCELILRQFVFKARMAELNDRFAALRRY